MSDTQPQDTPISAAQAILGLLNALPPLQHLQTVKSSQTGREYSVVAEKEGSLFAINFQGGLSAPILKLPPSKTNRPTFTIIIRYIEIPVESQNSPRFTSLQFVEADDFDGVGRVFRGRKMGFPIIEMPCSSVEIHEAMQGQSVGSKLADIIVDVIHKAEWVPMANHQAIHQLCMTTTDNLPPPPKWVFVVLTDLPEVKQFSTPPKN